MGWFDGWFGGGGGEADPLRKLDPKLREFLEKESPVKYTTATEQQQREQQERQRQEQQNQQDQLRQKSQQQPGSTDDANSPSVPRESLFQDGRYAHLWKNYRPQAVIDAEHKSDHEKMTDVLEGYKERKAMIGRAALENCADEQMDWNLCMKEGDWMKRARMCSEEVRRFERCYMTQSRLLKALGYLSSYQRPPEVDEQIQMRADELYHKMLNQEAAAEKARAEGLPVPAFAPLIQQQQPTTTTATGTKPGAVPLEPGPNTIKEWKEKLGKLPEQDRAAEEEALRAEYKAKAEMAERLHALWEEQAKEREKRKAEGNETITDKVKGLFGR